MCASNMTKTSRVKEKKPQEITYKELEHFSRKIFDYFTHNFWLKHKTQKFDAEGAVKLCLAPMALIATFMVRTIDSSHETQLEILNKTLTHIENVMSEQILKKIAERQMH